MPITLRFPYDHEQDKVASVMQNTWVQEWDFLPYWDQCKQDIDLLITLLQEMQQGINLASGLVPCTFMLAYNQSQQIVGRVSIRHELNDFLLQKGGHIGYGVLPEYRLKGYASEILRQALIYCQDQLHLPKVLVTCDDDNIGSWKVIETNGGVLENKVDSVHGSTRRYWIKLK